jgi:hypothetical protein
MARAFIPPYYSPAHLWATTIEDNLTISKIDIATDDSTEKYLPVILARLPPDIIQVLPSKKNINEVLTYLKTHDKKKLEFNEVFDCKWQNMSSYKTRFAMAKRELRVTLAANTSEDTVSELAWQSVLKAMPDSARPFMMVLGIGRYPTADQMEVVDKAMTLPSASTSICAVSQDIVTADTVAAIQASTSSDMSRRMTALEEKVDRLLQATENSRPIQNTQTWQNSQIGHNNNNRPSIGFNAPQNNV